ncbi:energy transducer TonB [Comamonas guangdongensis]|uniref:Energy transducer TonB n=1 Tax=Comamonas guangdongensis TaxID=510515 RepID=A0ABV3ZST6_9BURK
MEISRHSRCLALCTSFLTALLLGACAGAIPPQAVEPTPEPQADSTPASSGQAEGWPAWIAADCIPPGQLERSPRAQQRGTPVIHANWFPQGLQIQVVVRLEVTPQGELGRVAYLPAGTDPRIMAAITRSLKRWKFEPGMRDGKPVTACFEQPYALSFPRQDIPSSAAGKQ